MSDNITWQRPDYKESASDWKLMTVVTKGEKAVKAEREKHLPKPNPSDDSKENTDRYEQYLQRAVFYPATGRTQKGLTSLVFQKQPTITAPNVLNYINTDVDGSNNSLLKQAQKVLAKQLSHGRHGLFTDYPNVEKEVTSQAEKEKLKLRPSIISVRAEQIINWRTSKVGGVHVLSLVVFREAAEEVGDFETKTIEQYRELVLLNGIYNVRIWRKDDKKDEWGIHDEYTPRDGSGEEWKEIPFQFVGSENNDPEIDEAPLLDLARINLAHYRNSADYEDSVYFTGQVQPWMSNVDETWVEMMKKDGVYIGSRSLLPVPAGGSFGFAQAQPNSMVKEAMDAKEKQMVALGAYLIEKGGAVKTATQQRSEDAVSHSVVSLCATNLAEAYEQCLRWMIKYENQGESEEISVSLNQEFMTQLLDPQVVAVMVDAWQKGLIAKKDARNYLRNTNGIDPERTDEMIDEELDDEPGLPLDGGVNNPASGAAASGDAS